MCSPDPSEISRLRKPNMRSQLKIYEIHRLKKISWAQINREKRVKDLRCLIFIYKI